MGQRELKSAYSTYAHLATMLAQGWQIEPPVYVRQRWLSRLRAKRQNTYHFILRLGERSGLISVFDCPEVQQLLQDSDLTIDCL